MKLHLKQPKDEVYVTAIIPYLKGSPPENYAILHTDRERKTFFESIISNERSNSNYILPNDPVTFSLTVGHDDSMCYEYYFRK
jgi:hypothetical protein